MTIETKYNIGDEVWIEFANYPTQGTIKSIDISVHVEYKNIISIQNVTYDIRVGDCIFTFYERGIFPTKEELLKSL